MGAGYWHPSSLRGKALTPPVESATNDGTVAPPYRVTSSPMSQLNWPRLVKSLLAVVLKDLRDLSIALWRFIMWIDTQCSQQRSP